MSSEYNFEVLKSTYDKNGWVVLKELFDLNEINKIKLIIKNFVKERINH